MDAQYLTRNIWRSLHASRTNVRRILTSPSVQGCFTCLRCRRQRAFGHEKRVCANVRARRKEWKFWGEKEDSPRKVGPFDRSSGEDAIKRDEQAWQESKRVRAWEQSARQRKWSEVRAAARRRKKNYAGRAGRYVVCDPKWRREVWLQEWK